MEPFSYILVRSDPLDKYYSASTCPINANKLKSDGAKSGELAACINFFQLNV